MTAVIAVIAVIAAVVTVTERRVTERHVTTPTPTPPARPHRHRPSRRPSRPNSPTRSAIWAPVVRPSSTATVRVEALDRVADSRSKPVWCGPRDRAARASCFFVAWSQ